MSISTRYVLIASMDVTPEAEALFNEVYDTEHVPNLLQVPGVHSVTRMKGEPARFAIAGAVRELPAPSTTVAFLVRCSDLFPGGWERMDERRINRGDTGALGRVAAGGKGANAPVVHAGAGGGIGGSVS